MPYHVELRRSLRRARAFNLGPQELRADFLEPWADGTEVRLGDRDWDPRECELTVLEGPQLASSELAHGQGWANATRAGVDVTEQLLVATRAPQRIAVLATDERARDAATELVGRVGATVAEPQELHATPGHRSERVAGALLVCGRTEPSAHWMLGAGLALGALRSAALVLTLPGCEAPSALDWAQPSPLDPGDRSSMDAAAARLLEEAGGARDG